MPPFSVSPGRSAPRPQQQRPVNHPQALPVHRTQVYPPPDIETYEERYMIPDLYQKTSSEKGNFNRYYSLKQHHS